MSAVSLRARGEAQGWGALLVAPNLLYLAAVLLVPLGIVAVYSVFTYSSTGVAVPTLTLANYLKLGDP
jgi:ABC-type spermidine/putrescine transport system permease subunit I